LSVAFNSAEEGESMSIRENIHQVMDLIKPEHILVSVFDKSGLEELVEGLLEVNPDARFYSTGGTGKKIIEILGTQSEGNYISVEDFTGAPEMEGGLVKTLHPKIHAGLLAERGNTAHEEYLYRILAQEGGSPGVYFDIFVGNLYPFTSVVAKESTTSETARVNIDIGGPAMTMASAKNWHSVAVLTAASQYAGFIRSLKDQNGRTTLEQRFQLATQAMKSIGEYRTAIGNYFNALNFDRDVRPFLNIS
jgi:phosphoribosylaminoimidazolecarboxamide formyltransferase/IMP cyclohydrolase